MNDDLVERLRDLGIRSADLAADHIEVLTVRAEAAEAERDALTAENRRLRDALQTIIDSYEATHELHTSHADCAANLYDHARFALIGEQK